MGDTINKVKEKFNYDIPLYNIRILRSYIDYVRNNYPNINIDEILQYAEVTKLQYNDSLLSHSFENNKNCLQSRD